MQLKSTLDNYLRIIVWITQHPQVCPEKITDETNDFEILTDIQHYEGKTNPYRLYNRLLHRAFLCLRRFSR